MTSMHLVAVALFTACLAVLVLQLGRRYLLDHPNERSSHTIPTPRGGGLAIIGGLALGVLMLGEPLLRLASIPIVLLSAISLLDDIHSLPSRARLLAHTAVAIVALLLIGRFQSIVVPGIGGVAIPSVLTALTLLWIIGLTNAYNFMDGIDGIATVQGIVAGATWWWMGARHEIPAVSHGGEILVAACVGFLPFNFPKARIFMGDVGSASLGLSLALLPLLAMHEMPEADWAPAAGVLAVWPFLFDTLFTMVRRARRGEAIMEAHRSHLYQRLVLAGWSHPKVTLLYGVLAACNGAAAIALSHGDWVWGWVSAGGTMAVLMMLVENAERRV